MPKGIKRVIQEFITIIERIEEMIDEMPSMMSRKMEEDGGIHKTILYEIRDDYVYYKNKNKKKLK